MKVGTVRGIGVYIHWTFWILIALYLLPVLAQQGAAAAVAASLFIAGVFASVVAHEFGHAFAAAHYGIKTADITLLPIGGVARLTRIPEKPMQELVIALAGPAVNVLIAGILLCVLVLGFAVELTAPAVGMQFGLMEQLIAANLFLVAFNLLPAFPMDGGRVLRSILAMRMSHLNATQIAARVGRWMALGFVVLSFWAGWQLLLVAGFVFLAGTAELMSVRLRDIAQRQAEGFDEAGAGQHAAPSFGSNWQTRVWPTEGGQYPHEEQAYNADDDVIDAVDVRQVR